MDEPRSASIHSLSRRAAHPAQPVKARSAHIHAKMSPDDAFRTTLSDCLAQMTANVGVLRAGRSVEGLHQLRVGLRRLEVALKSFGEAFEQPWLEELRGRTKVLSSRLGPARDLDVFLEELLAAPAKAFSGEDEMEMFAVLRAEAEEAREKAWKQASACVTGGDFTVFLDDVAGLAQSRLPLARDNRLGLMATRMLRRQAARAKKRGRAARSHEEGDLHRLRIALKKLRYTTEFFAPLYKKKTVKRYLSEVKKLPGNLGPLERHRPCPFGDRPACPRRPEKFRSAAFRRPAPYRAGIAPVSPGWSSAR